MDTVLNKLQDTLQSLIEAQEKEDGPLQMPWPITQNVVFVIEQLDEAIIVPRKVLQGLVTLFNDTASESEGRYPLPDTGCIECTVGTVPDKYNTGLCALHMAKQLLREGAK